jgi:Zn-finger nucleic acid-binding protein
MKCPVCKTNSLGSITLVDNLPAAHCSQCNGNWIAANVYMAWLRAKGSDLPEKTGNAPFDPTWHAREFKICPDCGHMLRRFKIFPDVDYFLDRCGNCNGIWFDANEWDALVERNLHDNLNDFFTRPWQDRLHAKETKTQMEGIYLLKFGTQDYEKIKEVRTWLDNHDQRSMLLAYLLADDPYKV